MPDVSFHPLGPSHVAVLVICAVVLVMLAILRRVHKPSAIWLERALGTLLLVLWPLTVWSHWRAGTLDLDNALPVHLCDVAGIAGGVALWTRRQLPCELVYFFGLAGTLQGLLTPNLAVDFPDARFTVFFLLHGGVVVTALHVVTSMNHAPRPWSVARMLVALLIYGGLAAVVNGVLGTNYGFLSHKPAQASLMDHLGPWPLYLAILAALAVVFFAILDVPFMVARRWKRGTR